MSTTQTQAATQWKLDPVHSVAEFKVRHMMISNVKGQFSQLDGKLILDNHDITKSFVEATIEVASITTNEAQRDAHLKSADFFDAEQFPKMTFRSTAVSGQSGELSVTGDLTIHGVTRPAVFSIEGPSAPAKDPWGNRRIGLAATTKINRRDFGLTWNAALETGGILVGEDVTIMLEVQFIQV